MNQHIIFVTTTVAALSAIYVSAADKSNEALAKAAQNPVASMISVPIQSTVNFGVGDSDTSYVNLVQPVIPQSINDDWNWIHRTIIPVPVYQPGANSATGLGDIQYEGFLSPSKPGKLIWGVGPYLSFPTASNDILGTEKWSAGPAVIGLTVNGPWVVGGLLTHLWSFAGTEDRDDVNLSSFQYFVNYNFPQYQGVYLTTAPVMTYNWSADSDQAWTVPIGGGIGKIFHIGKQAMNAKLQGFVYPVKPDQGPEWSLQLQVQFMFPQ